ncbi:MAG TPA: hypothetical protein VGC62_11285 [Pseudomonas sp.]|uniref:hypothetical protein n=1 Tax=Pseudomonas sp. TaxID=306 RepID=UPI002ED7F73B
MEVKKTVPMFFSVAVIGVCLWAGAVTASERGLALQGRIVNAGCDAQTSLGPGQQAFHLVRVNALITLSVSTVRNACGEKYLPLVARYIEQPSTVITARAGVLMLTYQ